jgi:hypothetical protein
MAGMFYSLQEVAAKLNKTKEEIQEIVRQGRLREFRDGPNLLFKVDEVESLLSDTRIMASGKSAPPPPEPEPPAEEEVDVFLSDASDVNAIEEPYYGLDQEELPELELEPELEEAEQPETVLRPELSEDFGLQEAEEEPLAEPGEVEEQPAEEPAIEPTGEEEFSLELEPEPEPVEKPAPEEAGIVEDSIPGLQPDTTQGPSIDSELTNADTALSGMGINVLGESDTEYKLSEDTMGETIGSSEEASISEIEEDVSLDSFGSGSGLLDLSLQADDTSLGGILDEIYTPEGEGGAQSPGTGTTELDAGTVAEQILADEQFAAPEPSVAALAQMYAEPEPDSVSNAFGTMLFLPLLAVIYGMVVVVAGAVGIVPNILESVQNFIWYIMGGLAFVAVLMVAIPAMMAGGGGVGRPKAPKPKKAKAPKVKKTKPPKAKKGKKGK